MFRAALALMHVLQPVLLVAGFDESVQLLQNLPEAELSEEVLLAEMSRVHLPAEEYDDAPDDASSTGPADAPADAPPAVLECFKSAPPIPSEPLSTPLAPPPCAF